MLRPIGIRYSLNFYDVALMNWARLSGVDLGSRFCLGVSLSVDSGPAYVVRNIVTGSAKYERRFSVAYTPDRRVFLQRRSVAFRAALKHFETLRATKVTYK